MSRVHQLGHLSRTDLIARWLQLAGDRRGYHMARASREQIISAIITLERG